MSPASLMPGKTFSDVAPRDRPLTPEEHLIGPRPFLYVGYPNATNEVWRQQTRAVLDGDRKFFNLENDGYFKPFFALFWAHEGHSKLHQVNSPPLSYTRATFMTHEGSFYPLSFIRLALQLFKGTHFDPDMWLHERGACPYPLRQRIVNHKECSLEETILPSLLWQQTALANRSAGTPPLVARVWPVPMNRSDEEIISAFATKVEGVLTSGEPRYCGYRFMADDSSHTATRVMLGVYARARSE